MSNSNSLTDISTETLNVEKLVYGGNGLARHEGRVYMLPKVAPGDTVEAVAMKTKSNMVQAAVTRVVTPSPDRVPAPCPHFERCGGCDYQQLPYELQLHWKREILRELFQRAKLDLDVEIQTVSAEPFGYRNRTQFHFHDGMVGFREESSHKLVPITQCPVSSPKINEILGVLLKMAKDHRFPKFLKSLEIFTNETDVQFNVTETNAPIAKHFFDWLGHEVEGVKSGAISYPAVGYDWKVSYRSFFQVNRFLVDALTNLAIEGLSGAHVLDLYAGVGLFSIPLSKSFERVTAVESGKVAMYDLEANSKTYKIDNVRIVQANVDAYLTDLQETPEVIIADPPRSGCGKISTEQLARVKAPEIRLVSCDPSTLVRDLGILIAAGYKIEGLTLIDLFPQTFHIETVTKLRLG
ncbi:class I SAM-dependent RNA methyltransferase [Bryobacter aggregatus]|uniref:class I SAM-dependent RNA methyltransferase n=1 Tax=Bryobacter aggregatus TaxID=360054 RepID=UPI00068FA4E1|nr:class I SAM-dependent RNA methyltransferase [Bryobacter aggregatus]